MTEIISKKTLEYLADLARIRLDPKKEKKLLSDLESILDYFKDLQQVDTSTVRPMTGGTFSQNVFRGDGGARLDKNGKIIEDFPEKKNGLLKIPPVFSAKGGSPPKADASREYASGGE